MSSNSCKISKGFTLVEILITLFMVGILVSFSLPIYTKYLKENRINEAKAILLEYLNYLQEYYNDNNNYKDLKGNDISLNDLNNEDVNKLSKYFDFVVKFDNTRQDKFILKAIPKEEYSQKENRYLTINQYGNIFICKNINNKPKCE